MYFKKVIKFWSIVLIWIFPALLTAQQSPFNAANFFAQNFYTSSGNAYRSASGAPGPRYWQNRADYEIHATIDTVNNMLSASETITYTNNSPLHLKVLWLQLDQNRYKKHSRSDFTNSLSSGFHTQGYTIKNVAIQYFGQPKEDAHYLISDTRMRVIPDRAIAPGQELKLYIEYAYKVPAFGGRTDYFSTAQGKAYEIAQWYPRMCVFDDLHGWNTLPYLGTGEFYCEYGDFDYFITLPENMIVGGSGKLVNEDEVLTTAQIQRLGIARNSDETVTIRTMEEVLEEGNFGQKNLGAPSDKTWHFQMNNTRDVAFVASAAYVWDAARINLPDGKKALAMSLYPVESAGADAWDRSTEYTKWVIEHFSEKWAPYPYPVAINVAGKAAGMEYPGVFFEGVNWKGRTLFYVSAHEIGHTWFPMLVGANERRHAWMDEGFNVFIDLSASDEFNGGAYGPKRDGEYAPGGGNPADEIAPLMVDSLAPSMLLRADMVTGIYRHPVSYFKPAYGLVLLRETILGPERFDPAFKQFIKDWSFKHPSPIDFFRSIENQSGEDLTWFWRGWFVYQWPFDLAVTGLVKEEDKTYIRFLNKEKMAFPFDLLISYSDGSKERLHVPIEVWMQGPVYRLQIDENKQVKSVVADPGLMLPDIDRENNKWEK